MKLAFLGTSEFAVPALGALVDAGHDVIAVYARAPKPAGRGQQERRTPVHELALRLGLPVRTPKSLKNEAEAQAFEALDLDAAVVVSYGHILPKRFLDAPVLGCINIHGSLLPRWRGAAPIQRALLAGDRVSGITIMQMEAGLDTGPIVLQEALPVGSDATTVSLSAELATLGGRLMLAALDGITEGRTASRPQPQEGVTYAHKIGREEGRLDWRMPSIVLERRVRALDSSPGAFFETANERIRVHAALELPGPAGGAPGTVLDDQLTIACGEGVLRLLRLQRPGRAPLEAPAFLRGFPIAPGTVLPCPATS
jgi:methionyl-tRNA formyltransferase